MVQLLLFNEYWTFHMLDTTDKQESHNPDLTQLTAYCEKIELLRDFIRSHGNCLNRKKKIKMLRKLTTQTFNLV